LASNYLKDYKTIETYIPQMVQVFQDEFNLMLSNVPILGFDSQNEHIITCSKIWINEADSLFDLLDQEKKGSLETDRIQFFLFALLLNEIKPDNYKDIPELIRKQTL
jgi:hypothetical protein